MKTVSLSRIAPLIAIILMTSLTLLLSGCGKTERGETQSDQTEQVTSEDASSEADAEQVDVATTDDKKASEPEPEKRADPPAQAETVEIPSGISLLIELGEALETGQTQTGDNFTATLSEPVVISDFTVFEAGSQVVGYVENSVGSGRLKTDAELSITIISVDGVEVSCNYVEDKAGAHADRNKKLIGGGALVGGILGALKGKDVKGAVVGAVAGAAVGTGAAILTGKENLKYEAGTLIEFTLTESVTVVK